MSRKKTDTVSYLIRDIPGDAWRKLKIRMLLERKKNLRDVLVELIERYGEGEPIEPSTRKRR